VAAVPSAPFTSTCHRNGKKGGASKKSERTPQRTASSLHTWVDREPSRESGLPWVHPRGSPVFDYSHEKRKEARNERAQVCRLVGSGGARGNAHGACGRPGASCSGRPLRQAQRRAANGGLRETAVSGPDPDAWQAVYTFPAYADNGQGLDYDPVGNYVPMAHEGVPGIYKVDYATQGLLGSITFSDLNPGWPWGLNRRNGVEYDLNTSRFFAPDFDGDQVTHDDNVIEYDRNGVILNAWETDDELGSNDSYDGSAIDHIVDIAVAPGPRYFVTAGLDGSVVYEINLVKTGEWWMPATWGMVASWVVPGLEDNRGISYDSDHGLLYHSDGYSDTIAVTDLGGTLVETFQCPGFGSASGVGYIEGKAYREIWVVYSDPYATYVTSCQDVPPPCAWQMLWSDDFESGYANWSMDGLWNPENEANSCGSRVAPFPSSSNGAYNGVDGQCTYNNGTRNSGSLTMLVDADLAGAMGAELRFGSYEETECWGDCDYDNRSVEVSPNGGGAWENAGEVWQEGAWYEAAFALDAYVGGPLRARFRFDTVDGGFNDFFGWMVDDVEIWGCFGPPDIQVTPEALHAEQSPDTQTQQTLQICNVGGDDLTWSLGEAPPKAAAGRGEWQYRSDVGVPTLTNRGSQELAYPTAYRWQPDSPTRAANILIYADDS